MAEASVFRHLSGSEGVAGSRRLPQQQHAAQWVHTGVPRERIRLISFHSHCCCDKSICRQGCLLWNEPACFLGMAAKFIFKLRKLRFQSANLAAVPGCPPVQSAAWLLFGDARTELSLFAQKLSQTGLKCQKRNPISRNLKCNVYCYHQFTLACSIYMLYFLV